MTKKLRLIQEQLLIAPPWLISKNVAAGLDGFVDSIVKVIDHKTQSGGAVFFNSIAEFGHYIAGKKGSGFSLETEELFQKLGGNMPILANAMAAMGTKVNCVGAFGIPVIAGVFREMHQHCTLHSFTNPGFTTAIEFADGKMMLAQMTDLNHADWNTIKDTIGLNNLAKIFTGSDLVCLVNWSELDHSNHIWEGLLAEVFAAMVADEKPRQFFFDLSDCSKRSHTAIKTALGLIKKFAKYGKVTLSLNKNEANILYKTFVDSIIPVDLEDIGFQLFNILNLDCLVLHTAKLSLAWDKYGAYSDLPANIPEPIIFTGAGDNFNAGFCMANLLDLDTELSLIVANIVSHIYISTGKSPDLHNLNNHISALMKANL
jgi:hypothetical protein